MTDAALLDHITRLPHAKANFKQLVRELGGKGATRAELDLSLARLLARGDLVEPRPGHYVGDRAQHANTPSAASTCTATATVS